MSSNPPELSPEILERILKDPLLMRKLSQQVYQLLQAERAMIRDRFPH